MNVLDLQLFLGFAVDELFEKELKKTNPYLVTLMIGKEEYLLNVAQQGKKYLGKILQTYPSIEQLKDMETHLLSLVRRLVPHYPCQPVLLTLHGT